jgi:hypothetical protein
MIQKQSELPGTVDLSMFDEPLKDARKVVRASYDAQIEMLAEYGAATERMLAEAGGNSAYYSRVMLWACGSFAAAGMREEAKKAMSLDPVRLPISTPLAEYRAAVEKWVAACLPIMRAYRIAMEAKI